MRSSTARSRRIAPLDGRCAGDNHQGFGARNRRRRRRASRKESAGRRVAFSKLSLPRNTSQKSGQAWPRRFVSCRSANRCRAGARCKTAMTRQPSLTEHRPLRPILPKLRLDALQVAKRAIAGPSTVWASLRLSGFLRFDSAAPGCGIVLGLSLG